MKKIGLLFLALMLTFTLAFVVSCNDDGNPTPSSKPDGSTDLGLWKEATYQSDTELGQGEKSFTLEVAADGKTVAFTIKTDATTVGDALLELNLIEGTQGKPGIYLKKVNGITAEWSVDKTYWAFYINGDYALSGVDSTDIVNGYTYKLSRES